jgi:HD-GYP domain-containing protein (c-di-GMP phosphodiesterase class II)
LRSSAIWLQVAGYLFLFAAVAYGLFQLFFPPEPVAEPPAEPTPEPVTLETWSARADAHLGYLPGHSRRVADAALALALACGLREIDTPSLEKAALLLGIGFLDIPADLLAKAGPLTPAERLVLETCATSGAERALAITGDAAVSQWLRWAHERFDGLGYPDGLSAELIPLPSRILHLALSLEAMGQTRPYREGLNQLQINGEINALAGLVYDPALVNLHLRSCGEAASL